jgi:hypothetical protein
MIASNKITHAIAPMIKEAMLINTTLDKLDLRYNYFDRIGLKLLRETNKKVFSYERIMI